MGICRNIITVRRVMRLYLRVASISLSLRVGRRVMVNDLGGYDMEVYAVFCSVGWIMSGGLYRYVRGKRTLVELCYGEDSVVSTLKLIGDMSVLKSVGESRSLLMGCVGYVVYYVGVHVTVSFMERSELRGRLVIDWCRERSVWYKWSVFTIVLCPCLGDCWEKCGLFRTRV